MLAFMPSLGALIQCLIVAFFVLFNKTFKADVTPNFISEMVTLKEKQQSRYPSISISEWMNTQEVQVEGGHSNERMNPFFFKALLPLLYKFLRE